VSGAQHAPVGWRAYVARAAADARPEPLHVPDRVRILATNPPFNAHSAFNQRALYLLDTNELDAVVLLFRHDHLQSESRTPPHCRLDALRRATQIFFCPWRPTWIAGTAGNGRWSNSWVLWQRYVAPRRPVWLTRRTALTDRTEHGPAQMRAGIAGAETGAPLTTDRPSTSLAPFPSTAAG
jgi:hypothetical protein